jgi:DNA repair protein SbcC/Rad50
MLKQPQGKGKEGTALKIRKLRLQNIKSYVDQEITFHEGVNFISGINGAGKSTLIEAIGYALFDYNPYQNVKELIRYGVKSGVITLEFCANDEREYRVVRKIGTSSLWAIYDLEADSELDLHGNKDVKFWLKDALGIDGDMELDHLFRDIIGVPQGTFVGPFLETESVRKKKFDAILKVEQYRTAFDRTGMAVRQLKDSLILKDKELHGVKIEVRDYDAIKEAVAQLTKQVEVAQINLKELAALYKEKLAVKTQLDNLKEAIIKIEGEYKQQEVKVKGLEARRKDMEEGLLKAVEAQGVIAEKLQGYENYLQITKEITSLEEEKKTKDTLQKAYETLAKEAKVLEAQITAKAKNIHDLKTKITQELTDKEQGKKALFGAIGPAEEALKTVQQEQSSLKTWQEQEEILREVLKQLEQTQAQYQVKLDNIDQVHVEEAKLQEHLAELPLVQKLAEELIKRDEAYQKARSVHDGLKERRKSLQESLEQTAGGLCPFLETTCQNIDGSLEQYFQSKIKETHEAITKVIQQGKELAKELDEAKGAKDRLIVLEREAKRLQEVGEQKAKVQGELITVFETFLSLPVQANLELLDQRALEKLTGSKVVSADLLSLKNLVINEDLEASRLNYNRLICFNESLIQSIEESKRVRLKLESQVASEIQLKAGEVTRIKTEGQQLEQAIAKLQRDLQDLEIQAAKLTSEEERLTSLNQETLKAQAKLGPFALVEEVIEKAKANRQKYQQAYEIYMQKKDEAAKVASLQQQKTEVEKQIQVTQGLMAETQEQQKTLHQQFKQDVYEAVQLLLDDLKDKGGEAKQHLLERQQDLQENGEKIKVMEGKLKEMAALEQAMGEEQHTLNLLEKVRGILKGAGTPIAKVYLENLSREADRLYRQVSLENVELQWRQDYEIALVDNLEGKQRVRTFKQFSGGEQMTAALAVRLALLKQQSRVRVGFFDEPTANLDSERRTNLADTIPSITKGFDQIFIISHDDTFDSITENVIQLTKDAGTGTGIVS